MAAEPRLCRGGTQSSTIPGFVVWPHTTGGNLAAGQHQALGGPETPAEAAAEICLNTALGAGLGAAAGRLGASAG
jgi:hypothetical protein